MRLVTTPHLVQAPVVEHQVVAKEVRRLTLYSPQIALDAMPGQFINVRPSSGHDPLLRRPFSLNRIDSRAQTVSILYKVVGRGTEHISHHQVGDKVDTIGPLGRGFSISGLRGKLLLVAGGMGIAPMYPLASKLCASGASVTCLYGVRCAEDQAEVRELAELGVKVVTASEDGCGAYQGTVAGLLAATLGEESFSQAFACGPQTMLAVVKEMCVKACLPLQVSVESMMACGLGVCLGCTCPRAEGDMFWHVCTDGPVFSAQEVSL
ncbi:MAG: dihydroorotate dehydrogenase electron transfer subunit [Firmicutes bacterium]|nr:dihydroorotate dehydrogenase electron transfer subunit [Dethiobacter sp.]MBS3888098.1 dihydroorotate dehydrogenase electron transfer subunit [Bacillota bacterium]